LALRVRRGGQHPQRHARDPRVPLRLGPRLDGGPHEPAIRLARKDLEGREHGGALAIAAGGGELRESLAARALFRRQRFDGRRDLRAEALDEPTDERVEGVSPQGEEMAEGLFRVAGRE
jgi:hypothetical protein